MTTRSLTPELLDALAPDHPDARHSRRDLRWINALMGTHRWLVRELSLRVLPGERLLEIGAGTGELGARIASGGITVDGLDLCPQPDAWPVECGWHQADARNFGGYGAYPVICGNLVFHHFTDRELADLGARLATASRLLVACEPVRQRRYQRLFAVLGRCGRANSVTMHDARASIAAGFLGEELPCALGLSPERWKWRCATTVFGAYRMLAWRRT